MNIYQIRLNPNIFQFEIWNINWCDKDQELCGHYTFWWNKLSKKWVFCRHGGFGNLASYTETTELPRFPTKKEKELLQEIIDKILFEAYFYNYDSYFKGGREDGPYLIEREKGDLGFNKYNCIFKDHSWAYEEKEFELDKKRILLAVELLK